MSETPVHIPLEMDELLTAAVSNIPRGLMDKWLGKAHVGDCVEIMDRMPVGSVGLIVTSPPYNIRNSTGNGLKDGRGGKWANAALVKGYDSHKDSMPHDEYVAWQRKCLTAMMRVLRDDGAIFYNHKWRVQGGILQDRNDIVSGFPVRQIIIWKRDGGFNFNPGYFLPTYEVIYLICKQGFKLTPKANAIMAGYDAAQQDVAADAKCDHSEALPTDSFCPKCMHHIGVCITLGSGAAELSR